jgi:hypothetical protein
MGVMTPRLELQRLHAYYTESVFLPSLTPLPLACSPSAPLLGALTDQLGALRPPTPPLPCQLVCLIHSSSTLLDQNNCQGSSAPHVLNTVLPAGTPHFQLLECSRFCASVVLQLNQVLPACKACGQYVLG